jgi:hypothetical protein
MSSNSKFPLSTTHSQPLSHAAAPMLTRQNSLETGVPVNPVNRPAKISP